MQLKLHLKSIVREDWQSLREIVQEQLCATLRILSPDYVNSVIISYIT